MGMGRGGTVSAVEEKHGNGSRVRLGVRARVRWMEHKVARMAETKEWHVADVRHGMSEDEKVAGLRMYTLGLQLGSSVSI